MSTNLSTNLPTNVAELEVSSLSMTEILGLMIKHYGVHEGFYNLSIEFQIGVGAVGPDAENLCPGATLGIKRLGIAKVTELTLHGVDAAVVNPAKKVSAHKKQRG